MKLKWTARGVLTFLLPCAALGQEPSGTSNPPLEPNGSESLWDYSFNMRGAAGFKDNVLLSTFNPEESGFWQSGLDLFLFRIPSDGTGFTFFASGDDRRYFRSSVEKEQSLSSELTFNHDFLVDYQLGVDLQYFYNDQVTDASLQEVLIERLRLRSHSLTTSPFLMRRFPAKTWVKAGFMADRELNSAPLDDYWEYGPRIEAGIDFLQASEASLSYGYIHRDHDTKQQMNPQFRAIPGTLLRLTQHEVEGRVEHRWDEKEHFRSRFRLGYERNEDNGPGFYDYHKYRFAKRFGYFADHWQTTLEGKVLYYDLDSMPSIDVGAPPLQRLEYVLLFRGEFNILEKLKVFAEIEHERAFSNDPLREYDVNTFMAGVDWEF